MSVQLGNFNPAMKSGQTLRPITRQELENIKEEVINIILPHLPKLNEAYDGLAEAQRMAEEAQRMAEESQRMAAEAQRLAAEAQRVEKEAQRVEEEAQRKSEEAKRYAEEAQRCGEEAKRLKEEGARIIASGERKIQEGQAKIQEGQAKIQEGQAKINSGLTKMFYAVFNGKNLIPTEQIDTVFNTYLADRCLSVEQTADHQPYPKINKMTGVIKYLNDHPNVKACDFRAFKTEIQDIPTLAEYLKTSKVQAVAFKSGISEEAKASLKATVDARQGKFKVQYFA